MVSTFVPNSHYQIIPWHCRHSIREKKRMRRGNVLVQMRRNTLTCTLKTSSRDKGRAIIGLIVCNGMDLGPLDQVNGLALGCYQLSPEVWFANWALFAVVSLCNYDHLKICNLRVYVINCMWLYTATNIHHSTMDRDMALED